jgi:TM2 domain-containing membrane protein YozV
MSSAVCPYCRTTLNSAEEKVCEGCATPHHQDCYAENGGCTVFGCRFAPPEEPKVAVSAPELALSAAAGAGTAQVSQYSGSVPSMLGLAAGSAPVVDSAITYVPPPQAKSKMTFIMLGIFLGALGGHNFYAGYYGKATCQACLSLLTLGFGSPMAWIWAVIEICIVSEDSKGIQFRS